MDLLQTYYFIPPSMNARFMIVWSDGGNGTALRYLLKFSADTSARPQRRRRLLVCLWLSIETDSRPVQGVEQTQREEQTRALTQSLLTAPGSGHRESSWHHLLLDVLPLPSSRQSHLISSDLAQFPESLKNAERATPCPPVPSAKCWNACVKLQRAEIIFTAEARADGWRTCFCKCGDSVQRLSWSVSAAAWNSFAAERQNFRRFILVNCVLFLVFLKKQKWCWWYKILKWC